MIPVQRDDKSGPFFDAARDGRLSIRHCLRCDDALPPEAMVCSSCGGTELTWIDAAGSGSLITWSTVHRAPNGAYAELVPYVVGVVELDEGPWIYGLVIGSEPRTGAQVRAVFPAVEDSEMYPVFREEG